MDGAQGSPAADAPDAAGPAAGWVLDWVDPASLVVGVNTRTVPALGRAFVGSIADRGVREPITVRRDDGGRLVVRKGQRRTLAAIEAGLTRVPVVIEPEPLADRAAREADRIIDQLAENRHRECLPEVDEVAAHQQLLELGLTAGQIARRTRTASKRVKATIAVAGSDLAAAAMARYHLSLDQAAVIAEFAEPDTVTALVAAARTGQFEHVAQRARDARAEKQLRERLTAELAAAGVPVVDRPDPYARRSTVAVRPLPELRATAETDPGVELTAPEHAGCPGHVAWLEHSWRSDEPVRIAYGCEGWRSRRHAELHAQTGLALAGPATGEPGGARSREEKAERRDVIANNRAWASATTVRRAWLTRFLARKNAPKDAPQWIAATLAAGSHDIRRAMEDGHRLALVLLGLTSDDLPRPPGQAAHPLATAARTAAPGRATVLTLGVLLAALEAGTGKDTWRHPTAASASYLNTLRGWGYQLSDVERRAAAGGQHPDSDSDDQATGSRQCDDSGSSPTQDPSSETASGTGVSDPEPDGDQTSAA